jgi:hypothetical protein
MSFVTPEGRLSVPPYATVPELPTYHCQELEPRPSRTTQAPPSRFRYGIDLQEGCLITNSVTYMNQMAHIVNAVRRSPERERAVVSRLTSTVTCLTADCAETL